MRFVSGGGISPHRVNPNRDAFLDRGMSHPSVEVDHLLFVPSGLRVFTRPERRASFHFIGGYGYQGGSSCLLPLGLTTRRISGRKLSGQNQYTRSSIPAILRALSSLRLLSIVSSFLVYAQAVHLMDGLVPGRRIIKVHMERRATLTGGNTLRL